MACRFDPGLGYQGSCACGPRRPLSSRSVPRFAAIDSGSNASRLLIVQANDPKNVKPFRSLRVPVRLGHGVFQTGRLDPESIDQCVAAMRTFAEAMEEAGVTAYRAVVTASARGASNADVLLDRVRNETGIALTAVDGLEEARLVALAVHTKMPLAGHSLLMDLGGGSLELSEVQGPKTGFTVSLPIGTVRLLEAFPTQGGVVTDDAEALVREYLDRVLAPHVRKLRAKPWKVVVATGGNFEALAKLAPAQRSHWPAIDVRAAEALLGAMKPMTARERATRYALRDDRADVIVPALFVTLALAKLARVSRIVVPGVGLKEGIVEELVEKHYRVWDYGEERDRHFGVALALGRRYHFDEHHGTQVAALALDLFDGSQAWHKLGDEDRNLLRIAALLHDVGDFVNPSAHHKHTQYIILNSDFMGLSQEHRALVAMIARYHRKSVPTLRHLDYRALTEPQRARVRMLAGLLRVADALDRGHRSKVWSIDVSRVKEKLRITITSEEDVSLEVWTVGRKGGLLEAELGRAIEVVVVDEATEKVVSASKPVKAQKKAPGRAKPGKSGKAAKAAKKATSPGRPSTR